MVDLNPDRPRPFGVQWRETIWDQATNREVKKVRSEYFPTKEKRDYRATELRKNKAKGMPVAPNRGALEEFAAFRTAIGDTPWQDVVAGWRNWLAHTGTKQCVITVDEAVDSALANALVLRDAGKIAADTYRHKRHKFGMFKEQFGHLKICDIKPDEVTDWINDFDEVESEVTFNNYRKVVSTLFTPYVESGVIHRNPIAAIKIKNTDNDKVGILTVEETAYLFKFAMGDDRYKKGLGRLALEFFVGLRFSSGCRLEKKEINFADKGITLPKFKIKTRKRQYIDGLPPQLWAWLAITPDECWDLTARQYMQLKSNLFTESKVPHPHNCARHSFATYHMAAFKNPGQTATILCHRSQELLWLHYKGIATEADGKLYQTIKPKTVATLSKDYVPPNVPLPLRE